MSNIPEKQKTPSLAGGAGSLDIVNLLGGSVFGYLYFSMNSARCNQSKRGAVND